MSRIQTGILRIAQYLCNNRRTELIPDNVPHAVVLGKWLPVKGNPAMLSRFVRSSAVLALTLVAISGVMTNSAAAATFSPGDTVYVNTDALNLRSDAGTDGDVRDVLDYGQELEILDGPRADDGWTWYQVAVESTSETGWVVEDYIASSLNGGDGDGSSFDGAPGVRVIEGPVNVRSSSGLDASIESTLANGAEVPTYAGSGEVESADGYDWVRILYGNGIQGWVATDYLEPLDYSPNLGSDDGWSTAEGVEVIDGPVNLRREPSLSGEIFDQAATGDIINVWSNSDLVSADGYSWVKLKSFASAEPLYAVIDYLAPVGDMPCSDGACYPSELDAFRGVDSAYVSDGPVNMRASASTSAAIVTTFETGDYLFGVDIVLSNGDPIESDGYFWVYATAAGFEGYVAIDFLTPVE